MNANNAVEFIPLVERSPSSAASGPILEVAK
jgi:hypothetical protein